MFTLPLQPKAPPVTDLAPLDLSALDNMQSIITCTVEGIVDEDDLRALVDTPSAPPAAGDLRKVRERHHSVARLLAAGVPQTVICDVTGYTASYLSTLLNAPSMQELVEHYRSRHTAAADIIAEQLRDAGQGALQRLVEMMDSEEGLDPQALLGLAKLGFDRSGHGPQSKHTNVDVTMLVDAAEIARLNREAREAAAADILHGTPIIEHQPEDDADADAE